MMKMNSSINMMLDEVVKQEKNTDLEVQEYLSANFIQEIEEVIPAETKCGEIFFSNKNFKLSCNHCQRKFVKLKSFSKHFLKLHLNFQINDIKLIVDKMLSDEDTGDETLHKNSFSNQIDFFDGSLSPTDEIKEENSNESIKSSKSSQNKDRDYQNYAEINKDLNNGGIENICKTSSNRRNKFDNRKSISTKVVKTSCPYCNKVYKKKRELTKHFEFCKKKPKDTNKEDNEISLPCKFKCGRTFQRKCDLSHHENHKHNPDGSVKVWVPKVKTYICETCGNCYQRKHYLIQHQRVHTGERPYSCTLCPKTFTKRNNLTLHMRHHSQERKFKCQYCGKGLTDANKLRMHEMIHTGLYPFKCDICGKKFPCNSKLNVHIKKHINDRIYKCDLCEKRFLDPETLKGHAAVHSDEKPFVCEICPARFPRKGALRLHMNLHNDKKKYSCKICKMEFHQYNGIYSHYKRHGIKYSIAYEKGECDGTVESSKEN